MNNIREAIDLAERIQAKLLERRQTGIPAERESVAERRAPTLVVAIRDLLDLGFEISFPLGADSRKNSVRFMTMKTRSYVEWMLPEPDAQTPGIDLIVETLQRWKTGHLTMRAAD